MIVSPRSKVDRRTQSGFIKTVSLKSLNQKPACNCQLITEPLQQHSEPILEEEFSSFHYGHPENGQNQFSLFMYRPEEDRMQQQQNQYEQGATKRFSRENPYSIKPSIDPYSPHRTQMKVSQQYWTVNDQREAIHNRSSKQRLMSENSPNAINRFSSPIHKGANEQYFTNPSLTNEKASLKKVGSLTSISRNKSPMNYNVDANDLNQVEQNFPVGKRSQKVNYQRCMEVEESSFHEPSVMESKIDSEIQRKINKNRKGLSSKLAQKKQPSSTKNYGIQEIRCLLQRAQNYISDGKSQSVESCLPKKKMLSSEPASEANAGIEKSFSESDSVAISESSSSASGHGLQEHTSNSSDLSESQQSHRRKAQQEDMNQRNLQLQKISRETIPKKGLPYSEAHQFEISPNTSSQNSETEADYQPFESGSGMGKYNSDFNSSKKIQNRERMTKQLQNQKIKEYESEGIRVTEGGLCFEIDSKQFVSETTGKDKLPKPVKKTVKKVDQKEELRKRRELVKSYDRFARHKVFGMI